MNHMFDELRAAVPTIQSDFHRLYNVAAIGEELAYLHDQEARLILFQHLQVHAKWWHELFKIGVKIDMKLFQSADTKQREQYLQSLIPQLLEKNSCNLEMTLDFCRSFDLPSEIVSLIYIEMMMKMKPSTASSFTTMQIELMSLEHSTWVQHISHAANGVDEKLLLTTLYNNLQEIHPLYYERILYILKWIVNLYPHHNDEEIDEYADQSIDEDSFKQIGTIQEEDDSQLEEFVDENSKPNQSKLKKTSQRGFNKKPLRPKTQRTPSHFVSLKQLEQCQQDISAIEYLITLHFPLEAINTLKDNDPSNSVYYQQLPTLNYNYVHRIPYWSLRDDPWDILVPILSSISLSTSTASSSVSTIMTNTNVFLTEKLFPLCCSLGIDTEEFNAQSLFATYQAKKKVLTQFAVGLSSMTYSSSLSDYQKLKHEMKEEFQVIVQEKTSLYPTKFKVWQLVYESEQKEMKSNRNILNHRSAWYRDQDLPLFALENALIILREIETVHDRNDDLAHLSTLKTFYEFESIRLQIDDAVYQFLQECSAHFDVSYYHQLFLESIAQEQNQSQLLLHRLIEMVIEYCWHLQVNSLDDKVIGFTAYLHRPNLDVQSFIRKAITIIEKLSLLLQQTTIGSAINSSSNYSALEVACGELVSRLLTEGNSPNTNSFSSGTNSNNAGHSESNSIALDTLHFWKAEKEFVAHQVTMSEMRRREDYFLGFAIFIVLSFVPNTSISKSNLTQQLDMIMRGTNKVMRRITSRSRLRASMAIYHQLNQVSVKSVGVDVFNYLRYLYCLAEMQELRLSSTEQSLSMALGLTFSATSSAESENKQAASPVATIVSQNTLLTYQSTRSLLFTWLHDEGHHCAVVELARDVLLLSPRPTDIAILGKLVKHMIDHQFDRCILVTLQLLSSLCTNGFVSAPSVFTSKINILPWSQLIMKLGSIVDDLVDPEKTLIGTMKTMLHDTTEILSKVKPMFLILIDLFFSLNSFMYIQLKFIDVEQKVSKETMNSHTRMRILTFNIQPVTVNEDLNSSRLTSSSSAATTMNVSAASQQSFKSTFHRDQLNIISYSSISHQCQNKDNKSMFVSFDSEMLQLNAINRLSCESLLTTIISETDLLLKIASCFDNSAVVAHMNSTGGGSTSLLESLQVLHSAVLDCFKKKFFATSQYLFAGVIILFRQRLFSTLLRDVEYNDHLISYFEKHLLQLLIETPTANDQDAFIFAILSEFIVFNTILKEDSLATQYDGLLERLIQTLTPVLYNQVCRFSSLLLFDI
jgi:hypothetical protein